MKVLIIDLETTGLDPSTDEVIEIGAVLYSVDTPQGVIAQIATIIPTKTNLAYPINKIDVKLSQKACYVNECIALVDNWAKKADYIAMYNAAFDSSWFLPHNNLPLLDQGKIVCLYKHFDWPNNQRPCKLIETAINHGVPIINTHRALSDCILITNIFNTLNDLPNRMKKAHQLSQEPTLKVKALVTYEKRNDAKNRGFHWNPEMKLWIKEIPESIYFKERVEYPFQTTIINNQLQPLRLAS